MELAGQLLVHTKEVADLATAHADIAGRYVHIRTDDLIELCHKRLTETHDLGIALATRGKVATALATTHRECGQRVLKCLLETKELQDRQVHGRVETQTALIRTNGTVELYTVADVHLYLALVVDPGHTEGDDTFRLHNTLNNLCFFEFRVLVVHVLDRLQHFPYCL